MEDPWANAWGDSSKSVLPEPSPLWAAPSVSLLHGDNEDDLSTPSWPKHSGAGWSATDLSAGHIWSATETSSTWDPRPSTFDEISLSGGDTPQDTSQLETRQIRASSLSVHEEDTWALPKAELQGLQLLRLPLPEPIFIPPETLETTKISSVGTGSEDEEGCSFSQSPSPNSPLSKSTSVSFSEDIDGFGSFENGRDNQQKGSWTPRNSLFPATPSTESANWDTAVQVGTEDRSNGQEDAWEAARRQKEKQDRHVPPELFSAVLRQLEELSKDMWEDPDMPGTEINDNLDFESLGLKFVLQRLSPEDMTLPPIVPFAKTSTMKNMLESLKLTRHLTSTRSSPMAMYLASKGSNSWEAAVKAKLILSSDDVTPPGWKIVDSSTQEESPVDDGKKKVGGIFSFFGRRSHNLSVDGSSKRSASPMSTPGVTSSKTSTPRTGSPAATEASSTVERLKPAASEPLPVVGANKLSSPITPATDTAKNEVQPEVTHPSAVSRFLGRIAGRSKTRSIDSLSLSADDLEFLADVPTSSNTNSLQSDDLGTMLETPLSLPLTLPLVPPSHRESPLPKLPPPPTRLTKSGEDLLSLFDLTPLDNPLTSTPPSYTIPPGDTSKPQSCTSQTSRPGQLTFEESANPSTHPDTNFADLLKPPINLPVLPLPRSEPAVNGLSLKLVDLEVSKSSASTSIPVVPPSKSAQVDDDDEFSDFLSSPAVASSQFNSFSLDITGSSSTPIPSIKMTAHRDDFGDFGETVNDYPGPKPPPSLPRACATVSENRKSSKKPDHSRTLSLLENAASRGRWLSPPSPIPEALAPPPASGSATVGTDRHKINMQAQQALAMAALPSPNTTAETRTNTWRLPPPPPGALLTPSIMSSTPVQPRLMPPSRVAQSNRSPSDAQLSAQDLSFFEGL